MKNAFILSLIIFSSVVSAEPPKVLTSALDAYVNKGQDAFFPELLKDSALAGEKSILAQAKVLSQLETFYGKPKSWEILAECPLNNRFRVTYYIMYLENGPLFGNAETYIREDEKEVAIRFIFNADWAKVMPRTPIKSEKLCDD